MNLPDHSYLQNGKYQLTRAVGQGGFGITYQGVWFTEVKGPLGTMKTEVPVCIKEYFFKDYCYRDPKTLSVRVHSETGKSLFYKFREKLITEARILSQVSHPHIVNVLEVFEENDTAYIAMEYISGSSLKYMLEKEGMLSEKKVLRYMHQIGEALQFVHENSILHLDIKPSNILIDAHNHARLIDFGVSKRYSIEEEETSTTMLTLSKGFASVEQYDSEGIQLFSPCPDIYSFGATLYNLLTGKIPTESILRVARPLVKPTAFNPEISPATEAVILKAMEINPADRYQTVKEMMAELERPEEEKNIQPVVPRAGIIQGDETELLTSVPELSSVRDDEETVLQTGSSNSKEKITAKKTSGKRKGVLIGMLIFLVVLTASAVFIWVNKESGEAEVTLHLAQLSDVETEVENPYTEPVNEESTEDPVPEETRQPVIQQDEVLAPEVSVPVVNVREEPSVLNENNSEAIPEADPQTEADLYEEYLSAGIAKREQGNLGGAAIDLERAKEIRPTEEVIRLIIDNETKIKEKEIEDRLAQYEEKMQLGRYIIVRKISSGKYGAIDAQGIEKIPCQYNNVDRVDEGRAFERDDHLFDVYNEEGRLVNAGVIY